MIQTVMLRFTMHQQYRPVRKRDFMLIRKTSHMMIRPFDSSQKQCLQLSPQKDGLSSFLRDCRKKRGKSSKLSAR